MFESINEMSNLKESFLYNGYTEELFLNAMRENYLYHHEKQEYLRFLSSEKKLKIEDINKIRDLEFLPHLFAGTMKAQKFCSIPEEEIKLTLTSSGTKGQKTQNFFNGDSLRRLETIADNAFAQLGYRGKEPVNYIVMAYDRKNAADIGTSWSDEQMLKLAEAKSVKWALEYDKKIGDFYFDTVKIAKYFIEKSLDGPIRLLGFPAFMFQMIEKALELKPDIKVDKNSFVLAGGGWKNHLGKTMSHWSFANYLEEKIGLPAENVRDVFGMAEHGIPYGSCKKGVHHCPNNARIVSVDPMSLEELEYGEEGLLKLYTPYNTALANPVVLSTDLVVIKKDCSCGIKGDYISSIRRGGISKHKGCAISALDILQNSREKRN